MRAATVFNFLLEATLMGSVMILILMAVRKGLRRQLSSKLICIAWVMVALRLLLPIALPNPIMNDIRPTHSTDTYIRPIAEQVRIRSFDAMGEISYRMHSYSDSPVVQAVGDGLHDFYAETSYGHTARWIALGYGVIALLVLIYITLLNRSFLRRLARDRIERLTGEELQRYHRLCESRKVKPIPVYWVDPLPSACLVGVIRPYIALPLTLDRKELEQVLAHELCHYKAHDHWWNAVRVACCVVHWFNPLVWLAAQMSRADQELACDESVTAPMDDEQRIRYASTLALAAARKSAPELGILATGMTMKGKEIKRRIRAIVDKPATVRWLCIAALCVASIGTLFAFGTAEVLPDLKIPNVPVLEGESLAPREIKTEAEAVERARKILASAPYLNALTLAGFDTFDMLEWEAYWIEQTQMWQIRTMPKEEAYGGVFEVVFDAQGQILAVTDEVTQGNGRTGEVAHPTYRTDEKAREPLYQHARNYAQLLLPGVELGEMFIDGDWWSDGVRYVIVRSDGKYFKMIVDEEPYIYEYTDADYFKWASDLYQAEFEREQEELRQIAKEIGGQLNTECLKFYAIEEGTELYEQALRAHSFLTEVYSYETADADEFVFGIAEVEGERWCVYFDPATPDAKYMLPVDDDNGSAISPYRGDYSHESESSLRYLLYEAEDQGWIGDWNEPSRSALVDCMNDPVYAIGVTGPNREILRTGDITREEGILILFEGVFLEKEKWNQPMTDWYESTVEQYQ